MRTLGDVCRLADGWHWCWRMFWPASCTAHSRRQERGSDESVATESTKSAANFETHPCLTLAWMVCRSCTFTSSLLPPTQCHFHRTWRHQCSENGFPSWCHAIGCVRRKWLQVPSSPWTLLFPSEFQFFIFYFCYFFFLFLFGGVSCRNGWVSERYKPQETINMEILKQTETIQISIWFMYRFLAWEKV